MSKFTLRTNLDQEQIIGKIQEDRGFAAKSKVIHWLIENYSEFERLASEVVRLKWEKQVYEMELAKIKNAIIARSEADKNLMSFCLEDTIK